LYCTSVADAVAEAGNFLKIIKGQKFEYPVVMDLESNSYTNKAVKLWTDMAIASLEVLERAGYFAMLYSGAGALKNQFSMARLNPYAIWVAQWTSKNTFAYPYGIWQYSDKGRIAGISGAVDLDQSEVNYPAIIKKAKLNNY
jgi:lysozyme